MFAKYVTRLKNYFYWFINFRPFDNLQSLQFLWRVMLNTFLLCKKIIFELKNLDLE